MDEDHPMKTWECVPHQMKDRRLRDMKRVFSARVAGPRVSSVAFEKKVKVKYILEGFRKREETNHKVFLKWTKKGVGGSSWTLTLEPSWPSIPAQLWNGFERQHVWVVVGGWWSNVSLLWNECTWSGLCPFMWAHSSLHHPETTSLSPTDLG